MEPQDKMLSYSEAYLTSVMAGHMIRQLWLPVFYFIIS